MSRVDVLPAERGEFAEHGGHSLIRCEESPRGGLGLGQDVAPDVLDEQRVVVPRALHDRQLALPQVVAVGVLLV